jgi:WD40 repeat protein
VRISSSRMTTLQTLSTPFNCDCVEINPTRRDRALIGMYEYEESSASRGGGFLLVDRDGAVTDSVTGPDWGVLDAQWFDDEIVLMACSDGVIRRWSRSGLSEFPVEEPGGGVGSILMTVDLCPATGRAVTISAKGRVSLLSPDGAVTGTWEAHSPVIESWMAAVRGDTVVTGSDDCSLRVWDARSQSLVAQNTRTHGAGTTVARFLSDTTILSGSYDERIRRFDLRNLASPVEEVRSIGGIWRLKPFHDLLLVAACYGGCEIRSLADLSPAGGPYTEHESMVYGIDCFERDRVVSCSFYDKSVRFWH